MSVDRSSLITHAEGLLLKAAFLRGRRGADAWQQWSDRSNLDDIETAQHRLLPLIQSNLQLSGEYHARVQGVYRRAWYTNRLLLHAALPAIAALRRSGIRSAVVKHSAVVAGESVPYPLDRFHLRVDRSALSAALRELNQSGWKSESITMANDPTKGLSLSDDLGNLILLQCRSAWADDFWETAAEVEYEGLPLTVAGREHQLLDIAFPSVTSDADPFFLRVAGTMMVLARNDGRTDWNFLTVIATRHRRVLVLRDLLTYAAEELDAPIAASYLDVLRDVRCSALERQEYRAILEGETSWRRLPLLWADYRRAAEDAAQDRLKLGVTDYLKRRWNVSRAWQIPVHAMTAILRPRERR